jgi:hypothetical protein
MMGHPGQMPKPTCYVTVLSGDIGLGKTVDDWGVITGTTKIVGSNSYHVVTNSGTDATAVLDGIIIIAGDAGRMSFNGGLTIPQKTA